MAISASQIVQINPGLMTPGGRDLELNGLILTQNNDIPTGVVLPFSDAESVMNYFGPLSLERKLSLIYFRGYDGSHVKPRVLYFFKMNKEAIAPWVRGAKNTASINDIKALTDGTLDITINQNAVSITGIDFSTVTSFSDVAAIIQAKLQAQSEAGFSKATCIYNSQFSAFVITGGEAGANNTISNVSGTTATLLGLTLDSGAIFSAGADPVVISDMMETIVTQTQNFAAFTTSFSPTQDEVLNFSDWAAGKGVQYLYVYNDENKQLLQQTTTTIADILKQENKGAVAGEYGDPRYSVFLLGIIASIDFNREGGAITTSFKSQIGLEANLFDSLQAITLTQKGMNYYGDYASRTESFIFHYPGQMFGKYTYIDTYINAIWFYGSMQTALLSGLNSAKRVPYNERGYTLIRAWLQDPINKALKNGVIDPGVSLSEAQKAAINKEAGLDVSVSIEKSGYYLQVVDPGPQKRMDRSSVTINLWYTYGGSVQKLEVSATAVI